MKTVELDVKVATTADVDAFDRVSTSARSMGDAVDAASTQADTASSRFDNVATSAENLDDRAGKATGALGALSAGFELVGAEKYAGALQGAAMATDFASGVGQAYNLVLELESVKRVKAVATSAAHKVATVASTAATGAATVAQRALNAALNANPLGLVITALTLVAGGLVLAYNKSETFRTVVDTAFAAAKRAVQPVVDTIGNIAGKVGEAIEWVRDKLPPAVETAKTKVVGFFGDMLAPVQSIYDKVVALIEKIQDIDFPKLPDLNPFRTAGGVSTAGLLPGASTSSTTTAGDAEVTRLLALILAAIQAGQVTVNALDVKAMIRLLRREGYVVGRTA